MESKDSASKNRLHKALEGQFPRHNSYFENVFVRLLIWDESDDDGFEEEAQQLKDLFEEFHYTVDIFRIPSENSYLSLLQDVCDFGKRTADKNCLRIIHYGGHADADDDRGRERRAVWTPSVILLTFHEINQMMLTS